jgi:hypothetical protein
MRRRRSAYLPVVPVILAAIFGAVERPAGRAGQPAGAVDPFSSLTWRYIGPPGNRVSAVAGVPGDPYTYYAGAASGGLWKTTDAGTTWDPIFDGQTA